ncbi:MAG: hypothetical protein KAG84_00815 [Bacteroidales bacterium]|nr:hypothetical protein [Bacteroidales bacterium]
MKNTLTSLPLKLLIIFAITISINSCWSDDFTRTKEIQFINNQELLLDSKNDNYNLQIRLSKINKPPKWYGIQQCSKYHSFIINGNKTAFIAYKLETLISVLTNLENKNIEMRSEQWKKANFYIAFENKDSLSTLQQHNVIINELINICNLKIDSTYRNVSIKNIKIRNHKIFNEYKTSDNTKKSTSIYSSPNLEINNSSLVQIASFINRLSENRYQYTGSDTNKYTLDIKTISRKDTLKLSKALEGIGLYSTDTYENILFLTITDKTIKINK